jgi:hypothetical protein
MEVIMLSSQGVARFLTLVFSYGLMVSSMTACQTGDTSKSEEAAEPVSESPAAKTDEVKTDAPGEGAEATKAEKPAKKDKAKKDKKKKKKK